MNQYIITEEQLERLTAYRKRVLPFMCPDERDDWVKFMSDCESHPYNPQAEREKMLDEAIEKMDLLEYARDPTVGAVVPFADVIKVLEKLREGKDGDYMTSQYRCCIVKDCTVCPNIIHNRLGAAPRCGITKTLIPITSSDPRWRPPIPNDCPLPTHSNFQSEREKLLREMQELVAQHCGEGIHKGWFLAYPIDRWLAEELREGKGGVLPLSAYERYVKEAKEADPGCDMSDSEFERMKEELRKGGEQE